MGKWTDATTDAIFLDSRRFFNVYAKKAHEKVVEIVKRQAKYDKLNKNYEKSDDYKKLMTFIAKTKHQQDKLHKKILEKPEEYAMFANMKAEHSASHYYHNTAWATIQADQLMSDNRIRHILENQFSINYQNLCRTI